MSIGEIIDSGSEISRGFVESQVRGELDQQIATAKRFPRSIKSFKERALSLATLDEETAASCFYSLPRDGKNIEGPSARLAEIVAASWGNLRSQASIVDEDNKFITARGMCWDLENNVAVSVDVRRRITNRQGHKFSDDMIVVTANAACSIALRNAVFKVIPGAIVRPVYLAARQIAIGDATTLVKRRTDMVIYFQKMGINVEQIAIAVGAASIEDITVDHLATLKGLATAIKEGDTSIDEAFPPIVKEKPNGAANGTNGHAEPKPEEKSSASDKLAGKLKKEKPKAKEQEEPPAQNEQPASTGDQEPQFPSTRAVELERAIETAASVTDLSNLRWTIGQAMTDGEITPDEAAGLQRKREAAQEKAKAKA